MQFGESALIHAAWIGNIRIVRALIAANANVNLRDRVSDNVVSSPDPLLTCTFKKIQTEEESLFDTEG